MTKAKAYKILTNDFRNQMIAQDWYNLSETDLQICKVLKITIEAPENLSRKDNIRE